MVEDAKDIVWSEQCEQPTVVSAEREPSSANQQHIDHVQVVQTEDHQPSLHLEQNKEGVDVFVISQEITF